MLTCAFTNSVLTLQKCEREKEFMFTANLQSSAHGKGLVMDMVYLLKTRNDSGDQHLELMFVQQYTPDVVIQFTVQKFMVCVQTLL